MRKHTFVATAMLVALVTAAPLANAQGRHRGGDGNGAGRQRNPSRADAGGNGGGGNPQRAERQAQPRNGGRTEQPRGQQQPRAEADNGGREVAPQTRAPQNRREPQALVQGNNNAGRADGHNDGRTGVNRYAVPRTGPVPRYRDGDHRVYVQPRHNYYVYGYPSYRYYGGAGYYGYRNGYYGYRYYDPYFAGDFYWSNHAWQARSYYSGSSYDYDLGKLRLDIEQRDAEVYIDGYYAGVIDDFDGVLQGLRLEPGSYQVQVALPGFAPLEFDVRITPGRTTTYRGSLLPE